MKLIKSMHKPRLRKTKKETNVTRETEKFERCILCGISTGIPVSMPVDWRENYELGVGQVCAKCAAKQPKAGRKLSDDQVILAVEQSRKDTAAEEV